MSEPFITRPFSIVLDAVRFTCAFIVLACHTGAGSILYDGPWPLTERASHYSVIIFFVLSGLVISASVAERQTNLKAYTISRITRILPVAAAAVAVSMLMATWYWSRLEPIPADHGYNLAFSALTSLTFLTLSGFGGDISWNPAYWSLCYEVWYYAMFGAAVFLKGKLRWVVLAVMAYIVGWRILLLLPVWLAGVWLNHSTWARSLTADRAPLFLVGSLVAMQMVTIWDLPVLFALRELVPASLGLSEWVISDYATAVIVVVALAALRPLAARYATQLERVGKPISYAAGFSFTLYLFHAPVLTMLYAAGFEKSDSPFQLALLIILSLAICAGIAELVERRTPALRRAVTRLLSRPTKQAPAVAWRGLR